jgi:hypothetical protein
MSGATVTTIHKFGEEAFVATRLGDCTVCGKVTRRSRTFTGTVSPFNKIDDPDAPGGRRPKTREEVRESVKVQAQAWAPEPNVFDHVRCAAERDHPVDDSPVPPEQRPGERDLQTGRLLDAMTALGFMVRHFGLALGTVDIRHGWGGRREMEIDVHVATLAEFLRWAVALRVTEIRLDCSRDTTYLRMTAPLPSRRHSLPVLVRMWQDMPRGPLGERLPGVEWEWPVDERGRRVKSPTVPIEHIRTALRRLRVPAEVADPFPLWADE